MRNAPLVALIAFGVLAGCAKDPLVPQFEIVTPACDDPAPLLGTFDSRAPSFIVVFDDTTNAAARRRGSRTSMGSPPRTCTGLR